MKKRAGILVSLLCFLHFISAQNIPQQIDTILARPALANNTWTILIENENASVRYYEQNPNTGKAPASNTKMVTTAAAFGLLGTNHFFETRIYLNGTFTNGILTGDLNLVSEHDPTWNTSVFSGNARAALDFIAGKLKTNGLNQVIGNVRCYGVCFYGYGSTADVKSGSQSTYNAEAATNLVAALVAKNISVSGIPQGQTGFSPPGTLFYTHKSTDLTYSSKPLRLAVACIPLNKVSHNPMADALLRHIGYKLTGTDSFAAGKNQVFAWLQNSVGISTNGMVMNDGSGLSSGNRFSAQQILSLTRYMVPAYPSWDATLPIGCVDGTISSRFCGTAGSREVHAKTGSLSSSIALSGYINNTNESRRYYFSFIANRTSIDQTATRQAIDDCVVLLGGRGVPISPEILSVKNDGTGNSLTINWSNEGFIRTGHRLYSSSDGINFSSPINLGANVFGYTNSGLAPGAKRFYRVTVLGNGGESLPSRVYGAQVGMAVSQLLVVDGNDRWRFHASRNPSATNHRFAAIAGQSISGPAFDTIHHNALLNGSFSLTNYSSTIWTLGEESTQDETFSDAEQTLVKTFLDNGGNLFVSGAEIAWDLDRDSGPTTADRNFYRNYLRATLNGNANDDANTYNFDSVASGLFTNNPSGSFDNGSVLYNVAFPDVLTPVNGSVAAINYIGGRGGAAAVTYDGSLGGGKLVNFGFPFETITSSTVRDAYMSDVLRFFGMIEPPDFFSLQINPPQTQLTLQWSASAGLNYRVQYKTNLLQLNWINFMDVSATNTAATVTDSINVGQKFYRVLLLN